MSYHLISWAVDEFYLKKIPYVIDNDQKEQYLGANSHGQLGQGNESEQCVLPREVTLSNCTLELQRVKKIVGGAGHTLILDNDGRVYSCGWNNKGQAGFPSEQNLLSFREIGDKLGGERVADVACGWDCSAALTMEGKLFLWGSNCYGQLGKHPSGLQWARKPIEITTDRRIKSVSIGLRHTALVTEDRKVLVTGSGNKGQLGLSPSRDLALLDPTYSFTEVRTLANIENVSCGQHHTIALTEEGNLYAFGSNKYGQLGLNAEVVSGTSFPTELPDIKFDSSIEIHSGWSHAIALSGGEIFSWGRNTYGQLGCATLKESLSWRTMRSEIPGKVRQISVGSEHNVALTEDGQIYCWGWNEHGNCGNGHTEDVRNPEKLLLPPGSIAISVGTGAGHTFAVIKKS